MWPVAITIGACLTAIGHGRKWQLALDILGEINAFERVFLKCVGYNMSVKGSQYAKSYFLLRTLGAKDSPDFDMQPLAEAKATRLAERCLEKQMQFREQYPEDALQNGMGWTM